MSARVAASMVKLYWTVADQYGISRDALVQDAGLNPIDLADPNGFVSQAASEALLRALIRRTRDPALGLRIARSFDLRTMGFWGYALMFSLTLGQRLKLHMRYNKLHHPEMRLSFRIEGDRAIGDFVVPHVPDDLIEVVMDFSMAVGCQQFAKHLRCAQPDVELWLTYRERPHHRALRALVSGPVTFSAPHFRFAFAAKELERRLEGDPHLLELARDQLEKQLASVTAVLKRDVLSEVRDRLHVRLASDASLEAIAEDLRMSARTLRRRLQSAGASFQDLLEEVRKKRAFTYLRETDSGIEQVAMYLGYGDAAAFRRAFRRWTGSAPATYREKQKRAEASAHEPELSRAQELCDDGRSGR